VWTTRLWNNVSYVVVLCVFFCFFVCLSSLCVLCLSLWIVHYWLPLRLSLAFILKSLGDSRSNGLIRITKIAYGYLWLPMVTYGYLCLSDENFSFNNNCIIAKPQLLYGWYPRVLVVHQQRYRLNDSNKMWISHLVCTTKFSKSNVPTIFNANKQ